MLVVSGVSEIAVLSELIDLVSEDIYEESFEGVTAS